MDPNIYMAYLCLTENNHPVRKAFKQWRHTGNRWPLERAMDDIRWTMESKYSRMFIFEAKEAWKTFNSTKFLKFLEKYGFDK